MAATARPSEGANHTNGGQPTMTHRKQTTALDEIGELLAEQGFDVLADALSEDQSRVPTRSMPPGGSRSDPRRPPNTAIFMTQRLFVDSTILPGPMDSLSGPVV